MSDVYEPWERLILVYAGFRLLSRHHALRRQEFQGILAEAGLAAWRLDPSHHLFWRRVEILKD